MSFLRAPLMFLSSEEADGNHVFITASGDDSFPSLFLFLSETPGYGALLKAAGLFKWVMWQWC